MAKTESEATAGCVFAFLGLLLVSPIWYTLMGRILYLLDAGVFEWVLFCIYVPVAVILGLARAITGVIVSTK